MTRLFIPVLLLGAAFGLFALYINPTYQASKAVAAEVSEYDDALTKSQELKSVRDKLISKRNTFSPDDVVKLSKILPDNVDNIRFVIDINSIAARHNITLKNVQLGSVSDSRVDRNKLSGGASGDAIGSATIGFSVAASYDDMLAFLADLEHSLRIIDVQSLDFTTATGVGAEYSFNIRTYWLH